MCHFIINEEISIRAGFHVDVRLPSAENPDIGEFHRSLPGYRPTPLIYLPTLAERFGLGEVIVKDEARRFDLKAFKILGASYAVYRHFGEAWAKGVGKVLTPGAFWDLVTNNHPAPEATLCTATDGNHGRAVARMARWAGFRAVIFMPAGTVSARIEAIRDEGAEVIIVDGDYDEAVRCSAKHAAEHGWQVIADTAYEGYTAIPDTIMAGYITLFEEVDMARDDRGIDMVFLQAGVGSFAAAGIWYYHHRYGSKRPKIVIVEPVEAACITESLATGRIVPARGNLTTMMAGLNCGTPSLTAWPIIQAGADAAIAISDNYTRDAMRLFYSPRGSDVSIVSGESGAAGLAALTALMTLEVMRPLREYLALNSRTRVLLINTEGDTDPGNFSAIVGGSY